MNLFYMPYLMPFLLLAAACGNGNSEPAATQDPGFEDIRWSVASARGVSPVDDQGLRDAPWILFSPEDGRFHGNGGCNNFFGGYEHDDDRLAIGNVASTQMACTESVMDFELAYLQALSQAVAWTVRDGLLLLMDENGDFVLSFREHQE